MRRRRYRLDDLPEDMAARIAVHPLTGCWEWRHPDGRDRHRYGAYFDGTEYRPVHRVTYEMFVAPIRAGEVVDHVYARGCRAKSCCNPAHLEAVSRGENTARAIYANITTGIAPHVLRRIGARIPNERDRALADAVWMLPFPLQPRKTPAWCAPAPVPAGRPALAAPPPGPEEPAWQRLGPDDYMTPAVLAAYFQVTEKMVNGWRKRGHGPPWYIVDGVPQYHVGILNAWIDMKIDLATRERDRKHPAA